jgi:phospholipid/cholesterol/gamma-HCH transport system permease protein
MASAADTAVPPLALPALRLFRTGRLLRELAAFGIIALGVLVTRPRAGSGILRPLVVERIWDAGIRLLPMVGLLGVALGIVIIGQSLALLTAFGAGRYIGTVMVVVLVRELGPLLTAILVIARSGTSTVVELGTVRALGEVEALESLGIDPIHYLVVPRLVALTTAVFCLAVYLIATALAGGYVFAFLRDVPLTPGEYFGQLAAALRWQDFTLLASKTLLFGTLIGLVSCYHGLARPLRVEDVSQVTTRAVVQSVVGCALLDAAFLAGYVFA